MPTIAPAPCTHNAPGWSAPSSATLCERAVAQQHRGVAADLDGLAVAGVREPVDDDAGRIAGDDEARASSASPSTARPRDAARDSPHPPRCARRPLPRAGEANTGALLRRANHFVANPFVANGFVARYFAAGGGVAGNVTFGAGANGSMPNFGYASAG
jgi:hypothetical protein